MNVHNTQITQMSITHMSTLTGCSFITQSEIYYYICAYTFKNICQAVCSYRKVFTLMLALLEGTFIKAINKGKQA